MRIIIFSLCFNLVWQSHAQDGYGNQFIFGLGAPAPTHSGAILNFNVDTIEISTAVKEMWMGSTSTVMCDSVGKLLFYSNGCYVANTNHDMMTNGDSLAKNLLISFCNATSSPLTQANISLPKPGSQHLYYLFYTDLGSYQLPDGNNSLAVRNLYYSLIDMSLEDGLGAVVEKNISVIEDTMAISMLQANRHRNGKDWWVVMPEIKSNCYWTMLITENGLDTVFKQCLGHTWFREIQGQAAFSPNAKQYARFNFFNGLNVFDFNDSTGLFSNPIKIDFMDIDTFSYSGVAFSPNSRFVYTSTYNQLYQFDTWANDVAASRLLIADLLPTPPSNTSYKTRFVQSRLAPDGKIYIAGGGQHEYLHVIHNPNCFGLACNLEQYGVYLGGIYNSWTMPNMPHYKHWNENDTCNATSVLPEVDYAVPSIRFFPNPASESLLAQGLESNDVLEFFDVSGRQIKRVTYDNGYIKIRELPKGLYFVKVSRRGLYIGVYKVECM